MDHYFVNTKLSASGEFEVHVEGCSRIPNVTQRNYLGLYITDKEAIKDAKIIYSQANACKFCLNGDHSKIMNEEEKIV